MYQKRNSIFETNSSSIHTIVIPKSNLFMKKDLVPDYYKLDPKHPYKLTCNKSFCGDIDKLTSWEDRAAYLYIAAILNESVEPKYLKIVKQWFNDIGIDIKYGPSGCFGFIDDSIELISFLDVVCFSRPHLMTGFVFAKKSIVYTSGSVDFSSPGMKILARYSKHPWESVGWKILGRKKGFAFYIYGKGN